MKKGSFKYYLGTFIMSLVFMVLMLILSHVRGTYLFAGGIEVTGKFLREITVFKQTFVLGKFLLDILLVVLFPFVFTGIFILIDFLSKKLKSKKRKNQEEQEAKYTNFVSRMSNLLNQTQKFNVEDFRHLRENNKFQEVLKKLFLISTEGETENNNFRLVLRKFDKNTKEREAVEYLVSFVSKEKEKSNE